MQLMHQLAFCGATITRSHTAPLCAAGTTISSSSQTCSSSQSDTCTSPSTPHTPPLLSLATATPEACPLKFASRLNSMQARRDLVDKSDPSLSNDVVGWIARQGLVQGLDLVDLNYPQHFAGLTIAKVCRTQQGTFLKSLPFNSTCS